MRDIEAGEGMFGAMERRAAGSIKADNAQQQPPVEAHRQQQQPRQQQPRQQEQQHTTAPTLEVEHRPSPQVVGTPSPRREHDPKFEPLLESSPRGGGMETLVSPRHGRRAIETPALVTSPRAVAGTRNPKLWLQRVALP